MATCLDTETNTDHKLHHNKHQMEQNFDFDDRVGF